MAILGPGTLGCDLALHVAQHGTEVLLMGRDEAHARAALTLLRERLARLDRPALLQALDAIRPGSSDTDLGPFDVVFEALPENLKTKQEAWRMLERAASRKALLLTGTSSLPVAQIAATLRRPERLAAFHLFVPIHRSLIVEVVAPGVLCPDLERLAQDWGLAHVEVADGPGFVATRMGLSLGLEAMRILEEGVAPAAAIDQLMVRGYNLPVGPLELSDRIGLDVRLAIARNLFEATGSLRWHPPAVLEQAVTDGRLGRKSGEGFYRWSPQGERL